MSDFREIKLGHSTLVALVDEADYEAVMAAGSWHVASGGDHWLYAGRHFIFPSGRRGNQRLHTFLTGWPLVDHRNGDGLDNRRANLRPATRSQNTANTRLNRRSTSGFKGVNLYKRTGRWRAHIGALGEQYHLGYFPTAEAAALAYDAAARKFFGEFARLNFPQSHERSALTDFEGPSHV